MILLIVKEGWKGQRHWQHLNLQEVQYEPGEELHASSRNRASGEAAILLIVTGYIDTVLMPSLAARLSGRSSGGTGSSLSSVDDLFGGAGSSANGDDFSLDGDIVGKLT